MKFYIKKLLNNSLVKRCIEGYNAGIGSIFMLHRVGLPEANSLSGNRQMFVSPEFLEETIKYLRNKGFSFISIDEFHETLTRKKKHKKLISFTLDDGYLDNYVQAYPIFKSCNIPFTIYVTTSFIEGNTIPWWFALEDILINSDLLELDGGNKIRMSTFADKEQAFFKFRQELLTQENPQEKFQQLFVNYKDGINHEKYTELFLNWQNIETMSNDPLVTIGAHTISHPVLKRLQGPAAIAEMNGANVILQQHLQKSIEHIAYPFGGHVEINKEVIEHATAIGYKTGVTTLSGNVFMTHRNSLLSLPRIFMYEMDVPQKIEGAMFQNNFVANRGKRIIKL
jgi:peptidoglycan/xylan/chitin deacetylase (PgdA/CDA1 family)